MSLMWIVHAGLNLKSVERLHLLDMDTQRFLQELESLFSEVKDQKTFIAIYMHLIQLQWPGIKGLKVVAPQQLDSIILQI